MIGTVSVGVNQKTVLCVKKKPNTPGAEGHREASC